MPLQHRGSGVDADIFPELDEIAAKQSPSIFNDLFESLDKLRAKIPESAQVIMLGYIEGFTTDEIAERLSMSPERIITLRRKGLVFLRQYLLTKPQSSGKMQQML